ncbi:MAG: mechanosensitive ion channel [Limnochordia bacterium]|nr:mechanosensitive ion channel family protein [Limnochordia bacterium]MDD2629938.1 mechanosensitive ion channel [Limnochordia bacterium]MDD4516981.1 mechanosensitive ion channel [Limnochordia bacterium]
MQALWESALPYLHRIPTAALTLIVLYLVTQLIKKVIGEALSLSRIDPTLTSLVLSIISTVSWIIIFAAVFNVMGLTEISLALGGSIALVAMALATGFSNVTQDLLAGIFLISDKDFKVGYRIRSGNIEGYIEEITIRKTKIMDDEGKLHAIPNRTIDSAVYIIIERGESHHASQIAATDEA